ncbi:MAG: ABC transporter transmembrane domain-containing protein, partial [Propionibacteriaceae bacterium]
MARPIDPRLLRRTQPTWLAAGVGVGITTAILVISQAWLLSHVVVSSIEARHLVEIPLLGVLAAVFVGRALCAWATQYVAYRAAIGVKAALRHDVVEARLATPATPQSSAGLITVLSTGLDALDGYFAKYLPQFVLASIVPFVVIGVVFTQDWVSALIIVVTLPLIPVFMALVGWKTQERVERRWAIHERLARHFGDLVAGLPTLQVFGRAQAQERGLAVTEAAHRRETMGTLRWSFMSSLVLELIATLSVAVVAVAIGLRVVTGDMAFFPALFVLVLAPEAYLPLRLVGMHYHDSADGTAAANAAFEIIDQAPAAEPGSHAITSI